MQKSLRKILVLLWVSILVTASIALWSQPTSNPFEIKPRLKEFAKSASTQIEKSEEPLSNEPIVDSTLTDSLSAKELNSLTNENVEGEDINNPFEVDHVPMRKNTGPQMRPSKAEISSSRSTANNYNFLFWYLLVATILLAIVINTNYKVLSLSGKSIGNDNILKLFMREQVEGISSSVFLLYCVFFINFSVFIYLTISHFFSSAFLFPYYYYLIFVVGYYLYRHVVLFVLGLIFELEKSTTIYSFTIMVSNLVIGVLFLPCNFIFAFSSEPIRNIIFVLMVVLLIIISLFRVFRAFLIVSDKIFVHFFQFFIYLCAFEIAPLLILAKFLLKFQVL